MVATRFNQDITIATRHRTAAEEAQRLANARHLAVTLRIRDFGAELLMGVGTGCNTLTIAVQGSKGQDLNALAHEICRAIPDSGPVD